eukprot:5134353-Amphidinium_carterae.1
MRKLHYSYRVLGWRYCVLPVVLQTRTTQEVYTRESQEACRPNPPNEKFGFKFLENCKNCCADVLFVAMVMSTGSSATSLTSLQSEVGYMRCSRFASSAARQPKLPT